jgi:integrase/recombinase XerD
MSALAPTLQAFFTDRLLRQRQASPHTVAAYRDTLRMLLSYAADRTGQQPAQLDLADVDAALIAAFLDHLERDRHNSVRTRNARLAAIHSLFHFAAPTHPEHAESIARVLAIPPKRFDRALITYLTEPEVDALLTACDQTTWTGRRDHALLCCCSSPSKPACGSPNSPVSPAPTCTSDLVRTSSATAKAANSGSPQ